MAGAVPRAHRSATRTVGRIGGGTVRSSTDALARTLLSLATAVHALCALPLLGPVFGDAEWWTGPVTAG
ncbi:hypothetical protein, partial [Thermobifida halotolerans]|uniref:hypothetical protein n=1 Tax=Thermobifida halotolerans TaxID=483545 RepID=UPI001F2684ED